MFVLKCGTKKSKAVGEREGSGAVNLKWVFIGVYFSVRLAVGNCQISCSILSVSGSPQNYKLRGREKQHIVEK